MRISAETAAVLAEIPLNKFRGSNLIKSRMFPSKSVRIHYSIIQRNET
jgi:hypothetical protein